MSESFCVPENVVPKVRVELTQGHPYRFLSLSLCVPLDLISPLMFHNHACNVLMRSTRPQDTPSRLSTFLSMNLDSVTRITNLYLSCGLHLRRLFLRRNIRYQLPNQRLRQQICYQLPGSKRASSENPQPRVSVSDGKSKRSIIF